MFTPMEASRRESSSLRVTSDLSVQPSFYLQTVVLQTEVANLFFFVEFNPREGTGGVAKYRRSYGQIGRASCVQV